MAMTKKKKCRRFHTFIVFAVFAFLYETSQLVILQNKLSMHMDSDYPILVEDTIEDDKASFSSCLLFNDDNHFLIEWLAYHYTKLPLRRLVIAIDPLSQRSPIDILERWRKVLDITVWNDDDYFPKMHRSEILRSSYHPNNTLVNDPATILVNLHRYRQRMFYRKCMEVLSEEGKEWVTFIDTDELLFPNYHYFKYRDLLQGDTIMNDLKRLRNYKTLSSPCVGLPRLLFGSKEKRSNNEEASMLALKSSLASSLEVNSTDFMSLRWKWHVGHKSTLNKAGKSMLNISRIPRNLLELENINVHRPIKQLCTVSGMWVPLKESPFLLHHYIGSEEQWLYREDVRGKRTKEVHETLKVNHTYDETKHTWVEDFVEIVGIDKAELLLKGVGRVEESSINSTSPALKVESLLSQVYKQKKIVPKRPRG